MDRETYVAIKNVIKNELKITREDIIEIIREELRKEIPRFLNNTYKDEGIKQLINTLIARKIDDALKNKLTDGVSAAIRKVFDENYSMQIINKKLKLDYKRIKERKNQMKTFYRTANRNIVHPEFGIILKDGDRVLTSEARTNDEGKVVVTVFSKYWFDVPISVFREERTKVFTNS